MSAVSLIRLRIENLGPIAEDSVDIGAFTYFVGRNNAGKSHYLKAIELLLATRSPSKEDIVRSQKDKGKPIIIEGTFSGVGAFTKLVTISNHKAAIESAIADGLLTAVRTFDPSADDASTFGVYGPDHKVHNPTGFASNLLKVLPEPISIIATADTTDELKDRGSTALSKLKKEALIAFFTELRGKTKEALSGLDSFLHGQAGERSAELQAFEARLREGMTGEFAGVLPSVEFDLPGEEVIAKEMKIMLDDGYKSEIEQKGHGLQRAALLALLRVLAKYGAKYKDRPAPIFLIGELESFLHPYAQKQVGELLGELVEQYQVVTTTHSPFIIGSHNIDGYRRVTKKDTVGTKVTAPESDEVDLGLVRRHLDRRGNLEGLFADRVVLIEGKHDEDAYNRLLAVLELELPPRKLTLFVCASGKEELRQTRRFYRQLGFDDVSAIWDLDYLFSNDVAHIFKEVGLPNNTVSDFRKHIEWTEAKDPSLEAVTLACKSKGLPHGFEGVCQKLAQQRIFVLRHGAPEMYFKNATGRKDGWDTVQTKDDLLFGDELYTLMKAVLS